MKVASRMLAMALLVSASVAQADTQHWFTASNPTGGASIVDAGGPGQTPFLKCDVTAPAPCSWTITMAFANGPSESPIIAWASDLYSSALDGKIVGSNLVYSAVPAFGHPLGNPTGASPGLIAGGNGFDGTFVGSQGGTLGSFTLSKFKSPGAGAQMDHILGRVGDVAWANLDGAAPNLQIGGNGPIVDPQPGTELGVMITIMNFPEPSSLALLGLGALAMIRRRR